MCERTPLGEDISAGEILGSSWEELRDFLMLLCTPTVRWLYDAVVVVVFNFRRCQSFPWNLEG